MSLLQSMSKKHLNLLKFFFLSHQRPPVEHCTRKLFHETIQFFVIVSSLLLFGEIWSVRNLRKTRVQSWNSNKWYLERCCCALHDFFHKTHFFLSFLKYFLTSIWYGKLSQKVSLFDSLSPDPSSICWWLTILKSDLISINLLPLFKILLNFWFFSWKNNFPRL